MTIRPSSAPAGLSITDNTAQPFNTYAGSREPVYTQNEFTQIRGFGVLVQYSGSLDPVAGVQVLLIGFNGRVMETMTTDGDDWYLSNYIHKGKTASYTLKLVSTSETQTATVGGTVKFGEGNFLIP